MREAPERCTVCGRELGKDLGKVLGCFVGGVFKSPLCNEDCYDLYKAYKAILQRNEWEREIEARRLTIN